jgi:Ca-activated chloride channel family protein
MTGGSKMRIVLTITVLAALAALLPGSIARADQVQLNAALAHPVLKAGEKQTTYLKVSLTGFKFQKEGQRTPVNVALVIDTSGSMGGEKIRKAREAAIMAIERLSSLDITSVVTYNDTAQVLAPATKLSEKEALRAALLELRAGGSTALFAGVSKGAAEVRKFRDRDRVDRVILISDGIANVGPSSPGELGDLGSSLIKEGISVSTIGLGTGYNEDLMSTLARKSDGNHYFAENATDLTKVFDNELGDVLSVVAQEVTVEIRLAEGIRPVRVLGREASITGQRVTTLLNQIYSEQEKYILLEIEVPATEKGRTRKVADVKISYANMQTHTTDNLASALSVRFTNSDDKVEQSILREVMVSAVEQIATLNNKLAMKLRDQGKIDEARKALLENRRFLRKKAEKLESQDLAEYAEVQREDSENLEGADWTRRRKRMVEEQAAREVQRRR